ncbi:ATP-binding cassette domain-containing protein [Paenibacillus sp. FSL R7-277]|uniref:ATP-binding cassette domain-containing protein n=1 Tax=Paenibacillus sp. FSL R7-277 TaxID=1227352 RepID=UPI001F2D5EF0|nr:ATP-binding cassette domain-containing protein [Paenibacillus sp. FSL R7-277]
MEGDDQKRMVYALQDVSVKMNGRDILESVSCTLQEGKWISVIGKSGAGKSTLAKVFKGLLPISNGEYTYRQQPLPRDPQGRLKAVPHIGYVFQYPEQQLFAATVYQELAFALSMRGESRANVEQAIRQVMEQLGLPAALLQQHPLQLSGGLKRLVAIASVLIAGPELLILDEPTAGLDHGNKNDLLRRLKSWQEEHKRTVLFLSHQLEDVAEYSDEVIIMGQGRLLGHWEANELFLKQADCMGQAGLPAPEPIQLLRIIEEVSGAKPRPASCREAEIFRMVNAIWQARGL